MSIESKNGIYFDLDCLYDTRLASLSLIDERLMLQAIKSGYYSRVQDNFDYVDKGVFRDLYSKRDKDFLDIAYLTKMPMIIGNFLSDAAARVLNTPYSGNINIVVNIYPYKLQSHEIKKYLLPVQLLNNGLANITAINRSPKDLSLQYCREMFSLMIMYDYEEWLEEQTKNDGFKNTPIPEVTLFVPELYFSKKIVTDEDIRQAMKTSVHPFRYIENTAKFLIDLNMINIEYYNAVLPQTVLDKLEKDKSETPSS